MWRIRLDGFAARSLSATATIAQCSAILRPYARNILTCRVQQASHGALDFFILAFAGVAEDDVTVLVDFWTYGCYNCVNTLPHVTKLYETYKDKGLVVVGIHTPEFPFERSAVNVQAALKRHGISYPVAQDNDSATWNAWRNQYWPAQYIVDQHGQIVFSHAGEGQYEEIERTVRRLLNATS